MRTITLTENDVREITGELAEADYKNKGRTGGYCVYARERGDSVFVYDSRNVITAKKNTRGQRLLLERFGPPNGRPPKGKRQAYDSWFFNGYRGKGQTAIDG